MSIETLLKENTAALQELASLIGDLIEATAKDDSRSPVAATTPEAPAPASAPAPTRADVSAQINEVAAKFGKTAAIELLAAHGAKKLADVPEHCYGDLVAACSNILAGVTHG